MKYSDKTPVCAVDVHDIHDKIRTVRVVLVTVRKPWMNTYAMLIVLLAGRESWRHPSNSSAFVLQRLPWLGKVFACYPDPHQATEQALCFLRMSELVCHALLTINGLFPRQEMFCTTGQLLVCCHGRRYMHGDTSLLGAFICEQKIGEREQTTVYFPY